MNIIRQLQKSNQWMQRLLLPFLRTLRTEELPNCCDAMQIDACTGVQEQINMDTMESSWSI